MSDITIKTIPISKLFIDAKDEKIFANTEDCPYGVREPHTKGGEGYQRDPWSRLRWLNERLPDYSDRLCRPAEVSDRGNNSFAVVDGGGRFVFTQLAGLKTMVCRVHKGLTRRQEARLFAEFNSEVYKLRSVDNFIAQKAAGEPMAVAIAKAAAPYPIAASGAGTLKCVGPLTSMYLAFGEDYDKGLELIANSCQVAAWGWSGWTKTNPPAGRQIESKYMMALGMLIEAADTKLDKNVLHRVMQKNTIRVLEKVIPERSDIKLSTIPYAVATAKYLAEIYNRSFAGKKTLKINKPDIDNTSFLESLQSGETYSAHVRAARKRDREAEQEEAA